jgi:hypothetical protein
MVADSVTVPLAGDAGAVRWKVSKAGVEVDIFVKLPLVESLVVMPPVRANDHVPLSFVPLSPPLLLLLIAKVTVKLAPVVSLRAEAVGLERVTAILMLSVKVVCAWKPDVCPIAVK